MHFSMALVIILMGAVHNLLLQYMTTNVERCIHTQKFDKKSLSVEAAAARFNKGAVARVFRSPVTPTHLPCASIIGEQHEKEDGRNWDKAQLLELQLSMASSPASEQSHWQAPAVAAAWYPNCFHSGGRNPKRFFPAP